MRVNEEKSPVLFVLMLVFNTKKTTRTIIMKELKDSTDKPHGKPLPWDKILGIETAILFYEIEVSAKID